MSLPSIVHLDLKGAPWKVEYLRKVILFMKANGAKGVLIEWEDTFPYTSDLIGIGSLGGCNREGMYSLDEVRYILKFIKENGMEPIQLVQTIGHMEFVLKHGQYRRLRELPRSPAVLCPTRPESQTLVKSMIRQVLDMQPDATLIHIGADEAWHMNMCAECQQRSTTSPYGAAVLFLEHVKDIATYIKMNYPNVSVLMWDDMMRNTSVDYMNAFNLGALVQPVVWNYNTKDHFNLGIHMWERYFFVFPRIWIASAFKGANGSCQMVCSAQRYASNQAAWHNEVSVYEAEIKFAGVILTGWSRFEHFATLCELLPVSLPSLATCLRMWNCPDGFTNEEIITEMLPSDQWEGYELASYVTTASVLRLRAREYIDGDQVTTWLNSWQIEHDYTSPMHAENIMLTAKQFQQELVNVRRSISMYLHAITGRRSAEEFIQTFLSPIQDRVNDLVTRAEARSILPVGVTPKSDKRRPSE